MIASASYPTFLFYLPVLGAIYYDRLRDAAIDGRAALRHVLALAGGFFLPLAGVLAAAKDPRLLLFDPRLHAGLFRGSGYLSPRPRNAAKNLIHSAADLFGRAHSYYFEVARTEFSDWLPIVALGAIAFVCIRLARQAGTDRRPFVLALVAAGDHAGRHRDDGRSERPAGHAPRDAAAAGRLCALRDRLVPGDRVSGRPARAAGDGDGGLLVLLLHHVLVLPLNYQHLPAPSAERYTFFFNTAATPEQSLAQFTSAAIDHDLTAGVCRPRRLPLRGDLRGHRGVVPVESSALPSAVGDGRPDAPVHSAEHRALGRLLLGPLEVHYFTRTRLSRYVIVPSIALNQCGVPGGTTMTSPFATFLVTPSLIALLRTTSGSVDGASGSSSVPPVTSDPVPLDDVVNLGAERMDDRVLRLARAAAAPHRDARRDRHRRAGRGIGGDRGRQPFADLRRAHVGGVATRRSLARATTVPEVEARRTRSNVEAPCA